MKVTKAKRLNATPLSSFSSPRTPGLAGGDLAGLYSPQELNDAYRRLAGEAEARLTQSRMNMDMAQRLQSYPYDMLDVPMEQLIVRGLLK